MTLELSQQICDPLKLNMMCFLKVVFPVGFEWITHIPVSSHSSASSVITFTQTEVIFPPVSVCWLVCLLVSRIRGGKKSSAEPICTEPGWGMERWMGHVQARDGHIQLWFRSRWFTVDLKVVFFFFHALVYDDVVVWQWPSWRSVLVCISFDQKKKKKFNKVRCRLCSGVRTLSFTSVYLKHWF